MNLHSLFAPLERWLFRYMVAVGAVARCSDSPDYSGVNRAAEKSAELGEQAMKWYAEQYEKQAPMREAAAARANAVSDAQLAAMETATSEAKQAGDYRRSVYEPLEREIVSDARNFNTEGERERLAGLALGDVNQQFAAAREQGIRELSRRGVNPNDGGYASVAKQLALGQAAAGAGAATKARSDAITLGRAMKVDAASLGRGLPGTQATQAGLAINSGNSAVGNAQVPVSLAQSAASQVGQGYSQAMQGYGQSGNLYGQVANMQSKEGDGLIGGLAGLGMAAGGMGWKPFAPSDKNIKKDRKSLSGDEAMTLARKLPVDKWKYKDDSYAADGGKEHVGPMAQDMRAAAGEHAAPGGKVISIPDEVGITLAAVKNIDKRLARLEKRA